ncbi:MAG: homoserine dehydrogenase, partial [Clostridiaceae bacterium]
AKKLGYLEADPTSDLEGFDPMYKIGILGYLLTGRYPIESEIERQGITGITEDDFKKAEDEKAVIKLVGKISKKGLIGDNPEFEYSVKPEFVGEDNPLYNVNGSLNAVNMKFKYANDMFISGRGAGSLETGTAVVSDIISIAKLL